MRKADPEHGPRILFFSGGTALRPLSRALKKLTHRSIHIVTPFDSGGSSARLRRAFGMMAVGDVRNRLIALADETSASNPAIYRLLSHRLPADFEPERLREELHSMADGTHGMLAGIPPRVHEDVRETMTAFVDHMPRDFDLRGASVGNLMLAGGYLLGGRDIDAAVTRFSRSLAVRGVVCPITSVDATLAARLRDGRVVVGQHLITGKEVPPLDAPIDEIWIEQDGVRVTPPMSERARALIAQADLICYPMGSFFTSVLANLLPAGVGEAVASNPCPKVFVPSTGLDVEQIGHTVDACARRLIETLGGTGAGPTGLLDCVILDRDPTSYAIPPDTGALTAMGLTLREAELVTPTSHPRIDAGRLARILCDMT